MRQGVVKKLLLASACLVLTTAATLALAEGVARLLGYRPSRPAPAPTAGGGPAAFREHPTLGFVPAPGAARFESPGRFAFTMTKLDSGLRITHALESYTRPRAPKKEIWIFGCSFTQGWFLNDDETYAWRLQEELPDYEVVNFGVSAYGTLQSLIQLREALGRGERAPNLAVMAYADFQDQRNTATRIWRKYMAATLAGVQYPYARPGPNGELEILRDPFAYREFPFKHHSALMSALETLYDDFVEPRYRSHEVSKMILEEMSRLCRSHAIKLLVAGITGSPGSTEMIAWCRSRGIAATDISVDLSLEENNNRLLSRICGSPPAPASRRACDRGQLGQR
jgi:hypothetical protein